MSDYVMQAFAENGIWLSSSPSIARFHAGSTSLMLVGGGDRRIFPDAATGRNRYGTLASPAMHEVSFASTTASNISQSSFDVASTALARLIDSDSPGAVGVAKWFDDIRRRIADAIGSTHAEVLLAASGTDIELVALGLLNCLGHRGVTNIVVAPDETGSGVPRAAAGQHYSDFSALGIEVPTGRPVEGLLQSGITTVNVPIRDGQGRPRSASAIDADAMTLVELALRDGQDVLLHVLDTSKTGLSGVSREAARQLVALAPNRVRVLVDACQFRCSSEMLRQDLADGFMVAVTGSKFLAGPPFAGALLLPSAMLEELQKTGPDGAGSWPAGLADYCAGQDFPMSLRAILGRAAGQEANVGLGLRWIAALCHFEALAQVGARQQASIRAGILDQMRARVAASGRLYLHEDDDGECVERSAILPFSIRDGAGGAMSFDEARVVQIALREADCGPVCHVGQAVQLGARAVLRLSVSAPDITEVASLMATGQDLAAALRPVADRLDIVFDKLDRLLSA